MSDMDAFNTRMSHGWIRSVFAVALFAGVGLLVHVSVDIDFDLQHGFVAETNME